MGPFKKHTTIVLSVITKLVVNAISQLQFKYISVLKLCHLRRKLEVYHI